MLLKPLRESNDTPFIKIMQKFCQTDHTFVTVNVNQQIDLLKEGVHAKDFPGNSLFLWNFKPDEKGGSDLDTSMMLLFQEAKKKCTVLLSGECADELFGGYHWFHSPQFLDKEDIPML